MTAYSNQSDNCIAIGTQAAFTSQGANSIAIGLTSGYTAQGSNCIAIGTTSGSTLQGNNAIAIGQNCGSTSQGNNSIAIGQSCGQTAQSSNSIAIGQSCGLFNQQTKAIAIGYFSGYDTQGTGAIAIGAQSGSTAQAQNSIIINASGSTVNNSTPNTCIITPIRNFNGLSTNHLFYDTFTGELTWGSETPSSIKYKTNVIDLSENTIQSTLQLKPVEFDYKDNGKHTLGLIAEDVEKILPNIVQRHPITNEIESIEYSQLIIPLLALVKKHDDLLTKFKEIITYSKDG